MSEYCCRWMKKDLERVCEQHVNRFDCPDALVISYGDGDYGLIVHDGGSSFMPIYSCPWCGSALQDESVSVSIDGDPDSAGIEVDLVPHLGQASDEMLATAALAEWEGLAVRPLLEIAAQTDDSVAAELEKLRMGEADGTDPGEWSVDGVAADRWLRKHRPALAAATQ